MQVEIIGRPSEMPFLRRKVASNRVVEANEPFTTLEMARHFKSVK